MSATKEFSLTCTTSVWKEKLEQSIGILKSESIFRNSIRIGFHKAFIPFIAMVTILLYRFFIRLVKILFIIFLIRPINASFFGFLGLFVVVVGFLIVIVG